MSQPKLQSPRSLACGYFDTVSFFIKIALTEELAFSLDHVVDCFLCIAVIHAVIVVCSSPSSCSECIVSIDDGLFKASQTLILSVRVIQNNSRFARLCTHFAQAPACPHHLTCFRPYAERKKHQVLTLVISIATYPPCWTLWGEYKRSPVKGSDGFSMTTTTAFRSLADLKHCIRTCPVIDNHAHNIYKSDWLKTEDLLTMTTEATGLALEDTPTSLPHLRALKLLRKLYDLPAEADWPAIVKKRAKLLDSDADALMRKCMENTQTVLIDDGFDEPDALQPCQWHSRFTRSPCKRLVRIEEIASDILSSLYDKKQLSLESAVADEEACRVAWATFLEAYEAAIAAALDSPEIAGFKSAVCFTTGLAINIPSSDIEVSQSGLRSFRHEFLPECVAQDFAIEAKGMNDALVISTCKLIDAAHQQHKFAKPLQFHTGIGNKEIPVLQSNPACLQPLVTAFPNVTIILLHTSYPYTRIAGHLATVFKNVYLDVGAVFPEVSRDGQERLLRECMKLTPCSKLLWSTDGHWFPETFWLANLQGREAMTRVLEEYVEREDLTLQEAMRATKAIFFENSNRIYQLGLNIDEITPPIQGDTAD